MPIDKEDLNEQQARLREVAALFGIADGARYITDCKERADIVNAALKDRKRLEWIFERFNDPAMDTADTGRILGKIIAGGEVGDDIYPDERTAIDAAMKEK